MNKYIYHLGVAPWNCLNFSGTAKRCSSEKPGSAGQKIEWQSPEQGLRRILVNAYSLNEETTQATLIVVAMHDAS